MKDVIETLSISPYPAVTVQELIDRVNINDYTEDVLEAYIAAATRVVEKYTGFVSTLNQYRLNLDRYPYSDVIHIPLHPVQPEQLLVEYRDTSNQWVELEGWESDLTGVPARIFLPESRPSLHHRHVPRVRVTFFAGNEEEVNPLAHLAICLLAGHYYLNPTAYTESTTNREVPMAFAALCALFSNGLDFGGKNA